MSDAYTAFRSLRYCFVVYHFSARALRCCHCDLFFFHRKGFRIWDMSDSNATCNTYNVSTKWAIIRDLWFIIKLANSMDGQICRIHHFSLIVICRVLDSSLIKLSISQTKDLSSILSPAPLNHTNNCAIVISNWRLLFN